VIAATEPTKGRETNKETNMPTYDAAFLETLDPETRALVAQQQRDDTDQVDTERFAGERTVSLDALNLDETVGAVPDIADEVVDRLSGEFATPAPQAPAVGVVQDVLASLPEHLAETYRLVYMDQKTLREAGDELGIAFTSVRSRLQTIYGLVGKAVIAAGELD
jgi:DNA-directed RNA polymerase specialized sigma24 family protein